MLPHTAPYILSHQGVRLLPVKFQMNIIKIPFAHIRVNGLYIYMYVQYDHSIIIEYKWNNGSLPFSGNSIPLELLRQHRSTCGQQPICATIHTSAMSQPPTPIISAIVVSSPQATPVTYS